ncbi:MAG: nucleotidyl transferase AbiEii/AbiGii toxin family protein [Treponema sp.]|uniref:nucleotidyl transferase AbiEii/AbiGii toxin family protein n=1 Tax=Treponema sp. TaxID=166 RepID=UPI0025D3B471|nr:nucleotidyl transferase AbiEii/AbiGii toxin family protein [Treponema sp.]MBQ8678705.1 nucleotidyl transferase AbiEii/AbiGii toxin family protein [Treponema sp.]
MNIEELVESEIENGYGDVNARAKVCQDIILKAIANGELNRNVTIKGGVVMRSKTNNIRRATQDLDIDFVRYSLSDDSIDRFIGKLNCLKGIAIKRKGEIEELKQQDYHGKRVYLLISDDFGHTITSKLDLGVHNRLSIEQEEYCFDIAFDDEGASLLINSNEQMFTEKLRSLLRFGTVSTRYKDIFDMYYLCQKINKTKLKICFDSYIFKDEEMRENDMQGILKRVKRVFSDKFYRRNLSETDKKWIDEPVDLILGEITAFLETIVEE